MIDTSAALTVIDGTGAKKVVMITDPFCPYCSLADEWFASGNATRKILFLPLDFHEGADAVSEHILCAPNPSEEYKKVMGAMAEFFEKRENTDPLQFLHSKDFQLQSCDTGKTQLEGMKKAIDELGITGTPMFIVDGKLIEGADPKLKEFIK
jgi:thiol:disulfide interchange protein DsbC